MSGLPRSLRDIFTGLEGLTSSGGYSRTPGFLQSLHPVARLIGVTSIICASLFTGNLETLLLMALVPLFLSLASRIPLRRYLLSTLIIPLPATMTMVLVVFMTPGTPLLSWGIGSVIIQITAEGITRFAVFALRVWLSFASLNLLTLTMGIEGIIGVLATLHAPTILLQLTSMTYSFIRLSLNEAAKMLFAREARMHGHRRMLNLTDLHGLASIIAVLMLRTLERGERVYSAMKARGYELNTIRKPRITPLRIRDILFIVCIMTFSAAAVVVQTWH
jgi:cobalt/nickel transport system permease protein